MISSSQRFAISEHALVTVSLSVKGIVLVLSLIHILFNEITIGPLTLHTYGLMIGLGFLAAYAMCYYRGKKMKMEKSGDILYGIFWCAIIGGLVGTRLLYYIVEIPEIIKDPSILWNFKNGYVVYGGIIGGILVSWLYCRIKKVSFIEYFDLVMPAVALAQGFGRIGRCV